MFKGRVGVIRQYLIPGIEFTALGIRYSRKLVHRTGAAITKKKLAKTFKKRIE